MLDLVEQNQPFSTNTIAWFVWNLLCGTAGPVWVGLNLYETCYHGSMYVMQLVCLHVTHLIERFGILSSFFKITKSNIKFANSPVQSERNVDPTSLVLNGGFWNEKKSWFPLKEFRELFFLKMPQPG